ncbi:MAG: TrkA family potassium uptake protein [Olsenella sp.]|jgi:trk system potassium uptake protein TrkA|nr:TrkA family potassium uptake protein [Olsenella sp.]
MQIIIVGGGKTGSYLAPILKGDGSSVVVVDNRRRVAERFQANLPDQRVIVGNGTSPEVLERAGVMGADVVIAATGSDEVNLVVSTLAKVEYQVPRVVARVNNPRNSWMFNESMGVDVGINQADLIARSVQEGLDMEDVFTIMRLGKDDHALVQVEVRPGSGAVGRRVSDLSLPDQTVIIAIDRAGDIIVPNGDTGLCEGDNVLALTPEGARQELRRALA